MLTAHRPQSAGARKVYELVMREGSNTNIPFKKMLNLLTDIGFEGRIEGSHHIFNIEGLERPLNLQPAKGGKCNPVQVHSVRKILKLWC